MSPFVFLFIMNAEPVTRQFEHLSGITHAFINSVQVDPDVIIDPRRIFTYVRTKKLKGHFTIRVVTQKTGVPRVSKVGKYTVEGIKLPALLYVPSSVEGLENFLRVPERPVRKNHLKK